MWSAVYLGVAAATLPAVLPVMVGVLAERLGFGVVRAGYVASSNLLGVVLGSILCAFAVKRWPWHVLIRVGAGVMIATNLLTTLVATFPLIMSFRFMSGLGEGLIAAVCYAAMGRSPQPGRALAFYVAGQGLVGAIGMGGIPAIVDRAGWPWFYIIISLVALPAFWLAFHIDTLKPRIGEREARGSGTGSPLPVYALACILIFFVGMSAVWAFSERMGTNKGIDLKHLSLALSASSVANMLGSLLVGFVAHRLSGLSGILSGATSGLLGLLALAVAGTWPAYLAAVSLFFFAWGFYYPFQFRLLSQLDAGGNKAFFIPVTTGVGLTLGPAIGGILLDAHGTGLLCMFGAACIALSTVGALTLQFKWLPLGGAL